MMGRGKILDTFRVGADMWIYSMWHDEAGHYEMGVPRKVHTQIIEIEGDIIGREIEFLVGDEAIEIWFIDERKEINHADTAR